MSSQEPRGPDQDDLDRLIRACADLHGLEIQAEWQPQIRAHLQVAARMAALVEGQTMPDEQEPLPVFRP